MLDLHCHMLPNIDDGPGSLPEALQMARMALANGVTRTVVTPHIHPGRYENDLISIRAAVARFSEALVAGGIPLELSLAAEVRISPETMTLIETDRMPWLGALDGYRLFLLELPHSHVPVGTDKLVKWCLMRNVRPVIVHPERNKDVIRNLEKITPLVDLGCLLQVTAGSVAGHFGRHAQQRACQLLKRGWVTLLASDAHNVKARVPNLEPGRVAAARLIGEAESWRLVRDNPARILSGSHN
ncbi:MAG: CpsB/CapC family capsule biosynthesis tyrosine phosphatase [Gammaproteobacteria bacterium]